MAELQKNKGGSPKGANSKYSQEQALGESFCHAQQATRLFQSAQRKRLLAPENDPIRADMDNQEARYLEQQATSLLTPTSPLKTGSGGKICPPMALGMPGLEHALQRPDILSLEAAIQRTALADKAGVFELAIETAESSKAKGAVEQMICHQMAAAHKHAMRLLGESEKERDAWKCAAWRLLPVS